MKIVELPTAEELRRILAYDPETGIFTWKYRENFKPEWNLQFAGKVAGTKAKGGISINYLGRRYKAHRLAWVYVNGALPEGMVIDHVNCDPYDNRIANLRLATPAQNSRNSRRHRDRITDLPKGVYKSLGCKSYISHICVNGVKHHLGSFKTIEEAKQAHARASIKFGREFARV